MIEKTICIGTLTLDSGKTLPAVEQRVAIYGDPTASPTTLVLHALTGDHRAANWWSGLIGPGRYLDPTDRCIIGINMLGSCYGSTSTSERITIADIVRAQRRALDELGINDIALVIGGSMGGMQALQWAHDAPTRVGEAIIIGAHDHHSAMGIALNAVQRDAIALGGKDGLRLARKIAMLSYKSDALLAERHDRRPDRSGAHRFDVEGFLELQGDRMIERIDPQTYATLTHAMDSFDLRNAAWSQETPPLTFVGLSSDWLFRPEELRAAVARLKRHVDAHYLELDTDHGHDAFLAEAHRLPALLQTAASALQ
ncbi:MAG: alpha/beta fold hydrolase [Vulcanimicrobiaceae bacterium]